MDVASALAALEPSVQALVATTFTWFVTALGAALVFVTARVNERLLGVAQGFAAGVMLAASYWSLLAPAIEQAEAGGGLAWLPPAVGVLLGAAFVGGLDRVLPHLHPGLPLERAEGPRRGWAQATLLLAAITLHNIPEGLAVGVAFGAAAAGVPGATLGGAMALALGIGLQNFPEGTAVALPLRGAGLSRARSFMFGQASALVEPVAGVLGAAFVTVARPLLPYALSFAAGAMIFVVVEELIPESQRDGGAADAATLALLGGFVVMMVLDVALG